MLGRCLWLSVLLVSSCGGADSSGESSRHLLAVIPKGTTHEFWKAIHAGARTAARQHDFDIDWKGPTREDDRAAQIRVVEDFISRRVDGIVLAPLDDRALVPVLKDAHAEGIPVVIIDSDVQFEDRVSFVATDNERGGSLAAEHLGQLLGGRGKILVLRYQVGSASTMKREAGFLQTLQQQFPDLEVVSSNQYGGATTESAYQAAENLLVRFDTIDGIFCPNESTTFGMLRALQDAGRAGKVKFVGFDSSEKLVDALKAGEIHGLVLQNPFRMGQLGVETLVQHLAGEKLPAVVDTGVRVATPENMDQQDVQALLRPDLSILAGNP